MFRGLIDKRHNIRILTDKVHYYKCRGRKKVLTGVWWGLKYIKLDKELISVEILEPVKIHYERSILE